jgi:hypothetical protein
MLVSSKIRFLFFAFLLAALLFTTCDSPMGMGTPIDWEPPVLTLDPTPKPLYVRMGATLTGTVTDNVAVDRVILRDQATGELLFTAKLLPNDRWQIELMFTAEQNGETILADIVAYDKAGNSDARSIATVVLYIDIRPPIIRNISISRTDTRPATLESYTYLKELEIQDPRGEKKEYLYKYQNGWFIINGIVEEEETRIEDIALNIYDFNDPDTPLLSMEIDSGYSPYTPRWTIKEDDIIAAGAEKWGESYKTNYYDNEQRYYYRVTITATDKSGNESVEEEEGFICLWVKSDEPKGILDPAIGSIVSRGAQLPVDFFDDDSLLWAYAGLLTEDQWNGIGDIAPGVKIPAAYTNDQKLQWLKERLTGAVGDSVILGTGSTVYNWKYDKNKGAVPRPTEPIEELIKGKGDDEKVVYILTGKSEEEYGDYVLFTIAADKKLPPHTGTGPERTNRSFWGGRYWPISVIDENVPLIVFDTVNGSPEENTFPNLTLGEKFTIKGYTLRENGSHNNKVTTFRMAWIPFGMSGGSDNYISAVQKALSASNYPFSINSDSALSGVQHWEFRESGGAGYGLFGPSAPDFDVPGSEYIRQGFQKTFSVFGAQDEIKTTDPNYKNFTYGSKLENETKLFVFYAIDNMGHEVFRQLRLLGMKTPPDLAVYDISNKVDAMPSGIPNPNASNHVDSATGGVNSTYYSTLNTYNERTDVYNTLRTAATSSSTVITEDDRTIPFQIYPRETILKYWIIAEKPSGGDIAVKTMTMKDISYSTLGHEVGSGYKPADRALSFCEYYPDVTQRTFLFEAEDMLGNVARIQRTVAVTNAARLEKITTTEQNGTYGIGKVITLTANFSGQIYVEGGVPQLNIRYMENGVYVYKSIPCSPVPSQSSPALSLDFKFTVPADASGTLETMFETIVDPSMPSSQDKRPITLPGNTKIMDFIRKDAAFIPGYKNESVIVPNWATNTNSLQYKKTITLDGKRPVITGVSVGGKAAYTDNNYYFKTGETIEFTLAADKPITASSSPVPRLQYYIRNTGVPQDRGPYNAAFTYSRPGSSNSLVFSLPVNAANCPIDGELVNVTLVIGTGKILDNVDNDVNLQAIPVPSRRILIKKVIPQQPNASLGGNTFGTVQNPQLMYFASSPTLSVEASGYIFNIAPTIPWEDKTQYSINGGLTWTDFTQAAIMNYNIPGGMHRLQVRYVDRAGNEGVIRDQAIQVTSVFPRLVAAGAVQPNGWYTSGTLNFNLSFDNTVSVMNPANVSITLKDANTAATQIVYADAGQNNVTTVRFTWNSISGEMPNGLYISAVNLAGLQDSVEASGGTGTGTCSSTPASNTITMGGGGGSCSNLPYGGIKVDTVAPAVTGRTPGHAGTSAAAASVTQIQLTFNENVMKGSGTITVRPHAGYAVPPVFEDSGYYIGTNGQRYNNTSTDPAIAKTYIPSFYDIYNNTPAANRASLTQGTSMSALTLNARTGQSAGPYIKMTHGLIEGPGYTGNYNNTTYTPRQNGPSPTGTYMIPDIATKWVLDYQYGIAQNVGAVNNIRTALTAAKFRWQEIDVVSTVINNNIVTINLNEPLLKGLQWDVYYPAGTFTDMAGNSAAASGYVAGAMLADNTDYYFTSSGVQTPVIRVNRRSYDARDSNWASNANRTYQPPAITTGWNLNTMGVSSTNGWGIGDFNAIHYRVETESPGAAIVAKTFQGASAAGGSGRAVAAWAGNVGAANPGATLVGDLAWNAAATDEPGTWVTSNIIRRSRNTANQTYTVNTKNGTPESRTSVGLYRGFRSYNRDLTKTELGAAGTAAALNNGQGVLTFTDLEASKSYVAATATLGGESATGYEGVFRTVIVLSFGQAANSDFILVEGSNIKNGMPSVAGFPVQDAAETGDNRFVKAFFKYSNNQTQYYWVSTEIVCEWYFLRWGGNTNGSGTHQSCGEVNNYLMVGYGDLTYGHNISTSGGPNFPNTN